ncbi:MAG: hypothetical protein V4621_04190 [Pseudomonadota bacterium]
MSPSDTLQNDAVLHLNALAGQLIDVIERENALVTSADRIGFLSLQARKAQISREYELTLKAVRATKVDLRLCDEDLRAQLKERHARLQELSIENISILTRAQGTVKRLQERILNAARQASKADDNPAYTRNGKSDPLEDTGTKPTSFSEAV